MLPTEYPRSGIVRLFAIVYPGRPSSFGKLLFHGNRMALKPIADNSIHLKSTHEVEIMREAGRVVAQTCTRA